MFEGVIQLRQDGDICLWQDTNLSPILLANPVTALEVTKSCGLATQWLKELQAPVYYAMQKFDLTFSAFGAYQEPRPSLSQHLYGSSSAVRSCVLFSTVALVHGVSILYTTVLSNPKDAKDASKQTAGRPGDAGVLSVGA